MRRLRSVTLLALVVALGCSDAARDRVMHFFFEIPDAEDSTAAAGLDASREDARIAQLSLPPSRFKSVHPPFRARQCADCHDSAERNHPKADFIDACTGCHERYFTDEVGHGPAADGECTVCHDMHRSELSRLLTMPMPDLCIECHDEIEDLSEDAHGVDGVERCTRCHDPHFGTGMLLRPDYEKSSH